MNRHHIAILGGGLTGLSSAFHLSRRFPQSLITLIEKQPRFGGWVSSERVQVRNEQGRTASILLESGPRTLRPNAQSVLELIHLLGLKDSVITTPTTSAAAKNRYLHLPESPQGLVALPNSVLSAFSSSMRTLLLPYVLREPLKRSNRLKDIRDESLDSFLTRRFGAVFARTFGSALVHGIYAADSRELSIRAAFPSMWDAEERGRGSVVRGMLVPASRVTQGVGDYELGEIPKVMEGVSVYSFRDGMGTLTDALTRYLKRQPNVKMLSDTPISHLQVNDGGILEIKSTNGQVINPTHVVSAIPLLALNKILPSSASLPHLTANPTSSVTVINLVFAQSPIQSERIHPSGFGYLIPRPPEGYSTSSPGILGTVFDSSALSAQDSDSAGFVKLTVMMGGPYTLTPSHISLDTVLEHLARHLSDPDAPPKLLPKPVLARVHHHAECIPTPTPGHLDRMAELSRALQDSPWAGRLEVVGAGVRGVSVGDCVESGKRVGRILQ